MLRRHDSKYSTIGDTKDIEPEVLQGVLNFIDTNTQSPEQVEIPSDLKEEIARTPTDVPAVMDELTPLRHLNRVTFGIREQCKLITDLTYEMEDHAYGDGVLIKLTDLYRGMYEFCRKESPILPIRKDNLKFKVLSGRQRKKGVFCRRRIIPLFPTKTTKSRQAKQSRFGRKKTSQVSETTIDEIMNPEADNSDSDPSPMDVSDDNIAPFIDLASYRTQDEIKQKVFTTPGLLLREHITVKVIIFTVLVHIILHWRC